MGLPYIGRQFPRARERMVDEESSDVNSKPPAALRITGTRAVNPARNEGEVSSSDNGEAAHSAEQAGGAAAPVHAAQAVSPGRSGPGAFGAFLSGALGGFVVAAIAGAAGYFPWPEGRSRRGRCEPPCGDRVAQSNHDNTEIAGLDKRGGSRGAGPERRLLRSTSASTR